jgi:hypothetical protein
MADSHTKSKRVSYQPLHPSVRWKLEKVYVQYHDTHFQYLKPDTEWNPGWRIAPSRFALTSSRLMKIGSVIDIDLGKFSIRIYTPDGVQPAAGWPVMLELHGGMGFPVMALWVHRKAEVETGGWVLGDPGSDQHIWTRICRR